MTCKGISDAVTSLITLPTGPLGSQCNGASTKPGQGAEEGIHLGVALEGLAAEEVPLHTSGRAQWPPDDDRVGPPLPRPHFGSLRRPIASDWCSRSSFGDIEACKVRSPVEP